MMLRLAVAAALSLALVLRRARRPAQLVTRVQPARALSRVPAATRIMVEPASIVGRAGRRLLSSLRWSGP